MRVNKTFSFFHSFHLPFWDELIPVVDDVYEKITKSDGVIKWAEKSDKTRLR